jgi:hypothetical protein
MALEPRYQVNDWMYFEGEIEFEHGGTGAAMEFDNLEEFGEFETEVEKGGEVTVEELCAVFNFHPAFNLRVGHIFLPIGWAYTLDEPTDYFTVQRSETESNLIPLLWHETGAEVFGGIGPVQYQAQIVNGLDATGFSSSTWISRGHQGRFEEVNAENLAVAGRVDLSILDKGRVGVAGYFGNSADNRPEPDLHVPADVGIVDAHADVRQGPFLARGLFLYGTLQNAGAVSKANRNLSNNLNVKRTPVAKVALGGFAEAGVDALALIRSGFSFRQRPSEDAQGIIFYGRYDYYDTNHEMDAGLFKSPRWERTTWSGGLNYRVNSRFIAKSQYTHRTLASLAPNEEDTYSLGMGLVF